MNILSAVISFNQTHMEHFLIYVSILHVVCGLKLIIAIWSMVTEYSLNTLIMKI